MSEGRSQELGGPSQEEWGIIEEVIGYFPP